MQKTIYRYSLPIYPGDIHQLGQLNCTTSYAIECAEIVERHDGLVMLIVSDMQNALRLNNEIKQFTDQLVIRFADWETLPFDDFSPHKDIISSRIKTLYHLPHIKNGIVIMPINTLMQRVCSYDYLYQNALVIQPGQDISCDKFCLQVYQIGYVSVKQVMKHGEFSTHANLIDIYPMGNNLPYRIVFSNDKVNKISFFDIDNQRSLEEINTIHVLPANEFPTNKNAIELFRTQWRKKFNVLRNPEHIYQKISEGVLPAGIEYWQPLFFNQPLHTVFNYLPKNTLIIITDDFVHKAENFWRNIKFRYENLNMNPLRPLLSPSVLWIPKNELFSELKKWPRIHLKKEFITNKIHNSTNLFYEKLPDISIKTYNKLPFAALNSFLEVFNGSVVFSVENEGRGQVIKDLLARIGLKLITIKSLKKILLKSGYYCLISASQHGFIDRLRNRALICESDLMSNHLTSHSHCSFQDTHSQLINSETMISNFVDLHLGQPVVHLEHGIGRYMGLINLETSGIQAEYLILGYAGDDKLYVPVSSMHLVSRYNSGAEKNAPLHKLGHDSWSRAKKKAVEKIRDVAIELLDLYAKRSIKNGFAFRYDQKKYQLFCENFPFETTVDQNNAINAVINDMCQPGTMDRLICGDVGFGKTEIAMRAAFIAVENHKQVAILVPTALLAHQHYNNFCDRFARWPIHIEILSRCLSNQKQEQLIFNIKQGKINIIIGTHRLLQNDIQWYDLGLLIVDEEHRFGVFHKERIKKICENIDILTLTATPIPRTLNMAMTGIRDLSIINTPPTRRFAVKTFVCQYEERIIREAIMREVLRGGQVFYLHNNIKSISKTAQKISELVPQVNIAIGHAQMRERELERVMHDFYHQRFNVLVCTTIIESGIDIPTANTIIIERADKFGLAQLHQLRGRVGRSYHKAYAWLLTPHPKAITIDAQKRLEAISSLEKLGIGFSLASYDLEIRGAGDILGSEQSGQIERIGFSLYMDILKNAINSLKEGKEPSLEELKKNQIEIDLKIPIILPDYFIPDMNIRLSFYKRIASVVHTDEINELKVELIDRFGPIPDSVRNLLQITKLRLISKILGIRKVEVNEKGGVIELDNNHNVNTTWLITLLQKNPQCWFLDNSMRLKFIHNIKKQNERINWISELMQKMLENTFNKVNL